MSLAILDLLATTPRPDGAAVERFLDGRAVPIVEGPSITFLYRGEAEAVRLRHFVFGLPTSQPLYRVEGTDLWFVVLEVPPGSRIEYKLEVHRGGGSEWIRDPLNPLLARDPFGANSVCHGSGYEVPDWIRPDPTVRPGRLEEVVVPAPALGEDRRVLVYLPNRLRSTRRYPLLLVFDGPDYLEYAGLRTVLDNLIHRHEVAPLIVALCAPGRRTEEYAASDAHARHVVEDLLPFLAGRFPVRPGVENRGLLGASLGAVAALYAAWRHPGTVGRLLLQSGSFAFTDIGKSERPGAFEPVVPFVNAFRAAPGRPAEKVYVSCGIYESLKYENRSLVSLLQQTEIEVRYAEARDGHNWENWRDRLREGLSWLFPGPLGLVYD